MRPKYYDLAVILSAFAVIGAAFWLQFRQAEYGRPAPDFEPITPLADIAVPDKAVLSQMDRLERSMSMLASPPPQLRSQADLSAFGYVAVSPSATGNDAGKVNGTLSSSHRLTLAFTGRVKRFCVIDNQFYSEGAALPDGATIVKIESRRVLIAKKSLQQWLVADPLLKNELPRGS